MSAPSKMAWRNHVGPDDLKVGDVNWTKDFAWHCHSLYEGWIFTSYSSTLCQITRRPQRAATTSVFVPRLVS